MCYNTIYSYKISRSGIHYGLVISMNITMIWITSNNYTMCSYNGLFVLISVVIKAAVQLLYLQNNFCFSFLMFHYCSLFSSFHGYCNRLLIGIYLEITMVMALVKVHFVKVFMKIPYDANFRKKICCLVA